MVCLTLKWISLLSCPTTLSLMYSVSSPMAAVLLVPVFPQYKMAAVCSQALQVGTPARNPSQLLLRALALQG